MTDEYAKEISEKIVTAYKNKDWKTLDEIISEMKYEMFKQLTEEARTFTITYLFKRAIEEDDT